MSKKPSSKRKDDDEEVISDLLALLGDGGFSDVDSLLSFALAVGLFFDEKGKPIKMKEEPDLERLSTWPQARLIMHMHNPSIDNNEEMNKMLMPFLHGGLRRMHRETGGKGLPEGLKRLGSLIPP